MKPFTWSYSALTTYELCPKKYFHLYFAQKGTPEHVKDADSSFAADGKIIHDAMKNRVLHGTQFDVPLRHLEPIAKKFADAPGKKFAEMKLALTREFEPCDYFDKRVWVRVIIDLAIVQDKTAIVIDWKTGKVKDDPTQNALIAAVLSRWMPEITTFKTLFVWLASKDITPATYVPDSFTAIWNGLIQRTAKIEEARKTTTFPAKPSGLCGWCPVTQCPHFIDRSN